MHRIKALGALGRPFSAGLERFWGPLGPTRPNASEKCTSTFISRGPNAPNGSFIGNLNDGA
jgi:hypothetical protein